MKSIMPLGVRCDEDVFLEIALTLNSLFAQMRVCRLAIGAQELTTSDKSYLGAFLIDLGCQIDGLRVLAMEAHARRHEDRGGAE